MYEKPTWYYIVDFITSLIIAIIVPIVIVSFILNQSIMVTVAELLEILKELLLLRQ